MPPNRAGPIYSRRYQTERVRLNARTVRPAEPSRTSPSARLGSVIAPRRPPVRVRLAPWKPLVAGVFLSATSVDLRRLPGSTGFPAQLPTAVARFTCGPDRAGNPLSRQSSGLSPVGQWYRFRQRATRSGGGATACRPSTVFTSAGCCRPGVGVAERAGAGGERPWCR
jgi:hypothetical protein